MPAKSSRNHGTLSSLTAAAAAAAEGLLRAKGSDAESVAGAGAPNRSPMGADVAYPPQRGRGQREPRRRGRRQDHCHALVVDATKHGVTKVRASTTIAVITWSRGERI